MIRVLLIGDIIGESGRKAIFRNVDRLRGEKQLDMVIGNAENAAGGFGITQNVVRDLFSMGVDIMTTGNHAWDKREGIDIIRNDHRILRPANYPEGTPGVGSTIFTTPRGHKVGVLQVMGRVFMNPLDCPFKAANREVARLKRETDCIVVDCHAEATSEKVAMGWHLDGKVSAVVGTHTHVQSGDERILPEGTGYLTDAGMTGPMDGVIGMKRELVLARFLTGMPKRFAVASGPAILCGVIIDIDPDNGRCQRMERVQIRDA
jgi:metallophosphoesterase (TIGR00282 family)